MHHSYVVTAAGTSGLFAGAGLEVDHQGHKALLRRDPNIHFLMKTNLP